MKWWWPVVVVCALAGWATAAHPDQQGKACLACHADAHHGEFERRDGGACAACHTTVAWAPSTFGVAQHATTAYALDGKHVATPCSGCHPGAKPRTAFVLAGKACLDCHQNPHGQKFAAQQAEGGCEACHTTLGWKQWKVDHSTWPLAGGHARAPCSACHAGKTIETPVAQFRGVARACTACHADRHAQQFDRAPKKACTDCHDADAWKSAKFDHAKTKYALEGVHVAMPCARCHAEIELRNGDHVVAWRLGYSACKDCHANPHPKTQLDCNGCHGATSWKSIDAKGPANFDHDKTGFQLRAAHAQVACTKCHDGNVKAQPRTNSTCQACHSDPHAGRVDPDPRMRDRHAGGQCYECHSVSSVAWADVSILEQHRRTRMPLTGKHAVIECGACHRRTTERAARDLPTDCYGCHAKKYQALSTHLVGDFGRSCYDCHVTTAWLPALDPTPARLAKQRAEHERVFALATGGHRDASCASCHVDPKRARAVRCDGCHAAEELRNQHRAPVAPVATTCLRCHPRGARR